MMTIDALAARDYRRIADLVESRLGVRLPPSKRAMVEGRLRRRVRALELPDWTRTAGCCSTTVRSMTNWCR
ncbi:MAG TPA: hypothetical protein VES39_10265 [Rhodospirillales bacterium]|nr:hypothetical protein [Rhodospirillales bacterium]